MNQTVADVVIRGGMVVAPTGRTMSDIAIRDGVITGIHPPATPIAADREIDATGCFVLPGAIDAHVHLDGTEGSFVDDFASGSRAAVHGGVTTLGQMSFNDAGALWPAVRADLERAAELAGVDFVLHPGVYTADADSLADLESLAADGYSTVKLVTLALDEGAGVVDLVAEAHRLGMLSLVHCEDGAIIEHATRSLIDAGRGSLDHYEQSRPVPSETAAVERVIAIAEATGAAVYLVHVSSAAAIDAARRARARGLDVYVETRPIYLYLTSDRYAGPDGGRFVGMPPLRSQSDADALWIAIADGTIDTVATDHAPWSLADKVGEGLTIATTPKGMAELDTFLPLLYTEGVVTGRIDLERLVAVTAENPARLLGLYPRKGIIATGSDADIVVLDPRSSRRVTATELETRADYSVYEGMEVSGWPRFVLSRGEIVLDDGVFEVRPGRGRRVPSGRRLPPV